MSEYSDHSITNKIKAEVDEDDGFESQSQSSHAKSASTAKQSSRRSRSPVYSEISSVGKDTGISTLYSRDEEEEEDILSVSDGTCYDRYRYIRKVDLDTVEPHKRLTVRRGVLADKYRRMIPLPPSALPILCLPAWKKYTLDEKIPLIPAPPGAQLFARGRLGRKIRGKDQEFCLYDPHNYDRTVGPYNSLHDPYASSYFEKPMVKRLLMQQGLINENNQVLCSIKQFNDYRRYLKTLYNQSIEKALQKEERQIKRNLEMSKSIAHYESTTNAQGKLFVKKEKHAHALAMVAAERENLSRRMEIKEQNDKRVYCRYLANKMRERLNNSLVAASKRQMHKERVNAMKVALANRTQAIQMIMVAKDCCARERFEANKRFVAEAHLDFKKQWLKTKCELQEHIVVQQDAMRTALEVDHRTKSKKRQRRAEFARERIGLLMQKREQRRRHIWGLVRRYFYRWLNKVRIRKAHLPDDKHQSLWDIAAAMKSTVKYLMDASGYVKLDQFLLDLIKGKGKKSRGTSPLDDTEAELEGELDIDAAGHDTADNLDNDIQPLLDSYVSVQDSEGELEHVFRESRKVLVQPSKLNSVSVMVFTGHQASSQVLQKTFSKVQGPTKLFTRTTSKPASLTAKTRMKRQVSYAAKTAPSTQFSGIKGSKLNRRDEHGSDSRILLPHENARSSYDSYMHERGILQHDDQDRDHASHHPRGHNHGHGHGPGGHGHGHRQPTHHTQTHVSDAQPASSNPPLRQHGRSSQSVARQDHNHVSASVTSSTPDAEETSQSARTPEPGQKNTPNSQPPHKPNK